MAVDTAAMGLILPVAMVVLVFASIALARRPSRPPIALVIAVQVLTLVVGFGFGFSLAGVESSYLRGGVEGLVKETAAALTAADQADCDGVRRAYADGVVAIEEGLEGIGLQARVRRSLEQSAGDATRPLDTDASTSRE